MHSEHYDVVRVMIDGGREVCVRCFGELDADALDELRRELADAVRDNSAPLLVVDLDGTRYLGSAAIGALLEGCVRAREAGKNVEIINARGVVRTMLQVTGVLDLFGTPTHTEASFGGPNVLPLPPQQPPVRHHREAT